MTTIRLDAATLAKFTASGPIGLCDQDGKLVRVVKTLPVPDREPDLPLDEWKRLANEPGGVTTAELLAHIKLSGES